MQLFRKLYHLFHLSLVTFRLSTYLLSFVFLLSIILFYANNILYRFKFVGLTLDDPSTFSECGNLSFSFTFSYIFFFIRFKG